MHSQHLPLLTCHSGLLYCILGPGFARAPGWLILDLSSPEEIIKIHNGKWPKWLYLLQCLTGMVNYNIFRWWHTWTDDVVCKLWTLNTKTTSALVLVRLTQHLYMKLSPLDATYCMWLASNLFHSPLVYCLEVIIVRDHLVTMPLPLIYCSVLMCLEQCIDPSSYCLSLYTMIDTSGQANM